MSGSSRPASSADGSRGMVWCRLLINLLAALSVPFAEANDIKVLFLQNRLQSNGWKEGFYDFFVPFLDGAGGLTVGNAKYRLNVSVCEENLDASVEAIGTTLQRCIDSDVDVMVVGSSQYNNQIKDAAQEQQIPNLHCSGGTVRMNPPVLLRVCMNGCGTPMMVMLQCTA